MVVDVLCPSEQIDQSVDGGQFASQRLLLFGVGHAFEAPDVVDWQCAGSEPTPRRHNTNTSAGTSGRHLRKEVGDALGPRLALDVAYHALKLFFEQLRAHDGFNSLQDKS